MLTTSVKLRLGQYGGPVYVDIAELAVDVVDILTEVLPTMELKSTVDDVPGGALLEGELVVTPRLKLVVAAVEVVNTPGLVIPELVLADGIAEVEAPMLELEITMLETIAGTEEEIKLKMTGLELETAILELRAGTGEGTELECPELELDTSPDGTAELGRKTLELEMLGLTTTDGEIPAIELELAISELTEEL